MAKGGKRTGAGRPKGSVSKSTLQALKAKEQLIAEYIKNIKPINEALIKKARQGDIQAIRELHDRVYGKSMQPVEGEIKAKLQISFDKSFST